MKANNAPEKIFLTKNLLGELRDGWDALPSDVFPHIEYVRTDFFIEKACEWLESLYAPDGSIAPCHVHIIKEFKKYMKGE